VLLLEDGTLDLVKLNQEFDREYLATAKNPRWIPKPTVAYLWARTVKCKSCRAIAPLLKTRWLCKKDKKRVLLTMEPNAEKNGLVFGIKNDVPIVGGSEAQKKAHDKKIGAGTMSKSGAICPCCNSIMTMQDIRLEGCAGQLGEVMTAVVVDGQNGKEYRLPTSEEIQVAAEAEKELESVLAEIPFGLPDEPLPSKEALGFRIPLYGFDKWYKLFTSRQLLALGTFVKHTRKLRDVMPQYRYSLELLEAISGYLALAIDRLADYSSAVCSWHNSAEKMRNTFGRFALPIVWDFTEVLPLSETSGGYLGAIDWIFRYLCHAIAAVSSCELPKITKQSAIEKIENTLDIIITDPPYYDAIPYSDLMDFFYVWLRRTLYGLFPEIDRAFQDPLSPKWNHEQNDGELIDESSRFGGDKNKSKTNYEDGMFRVFQNCHKALQPEGRLVIVFAHKHPDAWETLVSAIIRAGFIVDGSWPIQTEMGNRTRALSSAALSSSVWLVCKKRPQTARPGWDNIVLKEMRSNITDKLRRFWDDGIRGPDFVWAATGPAMESYSKYPVVKKANDPGKILTVSEFLNQVRRLVLDFVVGRFLYETGGDENASGLDDITTYYLLHRHDFGIEEAPIGACILYAVSCGLSDKDLASQFDLFASSAKSKTVDEEEEEDEDEDEDSETDDGETDTGKGSKVKLKPWQQRKRKLMGYEGYGTRPIPLIDKIHCIMHLWKAGDVSKVDDYADSQGLRRNALFNQVLQALIEMAKVGSDERALLESISNHITTLGGTDQLSLF
jgi:adenine-specific DNA methylase